MKITIKVAKPRNPFFLLARTRQAGAHEPKYPQRSERRAEKQVLRQMLSRRKTGGADDV